MAIYKAYPVSIKHRGQTWNAAYRLEDGVVSLDSAYGSASAPQGRDPKATAERLLDEIVKRRH